MKNERFVIFAHARSGSTSLMRALNQHPSIRILHEPFNKNRVAWTGNNKNYKESLHTTTDLDAILDEIHASYNGIKTLFSHEHLHPKYNEHLLLREDKIVLLHRKNLLQSALSNEIAEQTQFFNLPIHAIKATGESEEQVRRVIKQRGLQPINIDRVRAKMQFKKTAMTHYKNFLVKNKKPFLEVSYEEIFALTRRERRQRVKEIFTFLGFLIPNEEIMRKVDFFLSPDRKINNAHTYQLIPNIQEIERELGGIQYGSVFPEMTDNSGAAIFFDKERERNDFETVMLDNALNKFGSPLFVVFEDLLHERYQIFKSELAKQYTNSAIAYSFKTNYLPKICKTMKREGAFAEVVSGFEYALAKKIGYAGKEIIFNGINKKEGELKTALCENAVVNVDNKEELLKIKSIANTLRGGVCIGIRLSSRSVADMVRKSAQGGMFERFGFMIENEDAMSVCALIKNSQAPIRISGYHMHVGANITDSNIYKRAAEVMINFAIRARKSFGIVPEYLDMGGGFAEPTLHITQAGNFVHPIGEHIKSVSDTIKKCGLFSEAKLLFEPGRFLVSRSTILATKVISVKQLGIRQLVTIDASTNILPTGVTNRHLIYSPKKKGGGVMSIVAGASCMGRDVFGNYFLPKLQEGDVLIIKNCGAYSISTSSQFMYPRPAVIWVDKNKHISVARHAETFDDLTRLDSLD